MQVHGWINAVTWGIIFPIVILLAHSLRSANTSAAKCGLLLPSAAQHAIQVVLEPLCSLLVGGNSAHGGFICTER